MLAKFDPLSSYFVDNAYAELRRMREEQPAYRHQGTIWPVVSLFRHRDIQPMLLDWQNWSSQRSAEYNEQALGDAAILLGNDPPLHTELRKVIAGRFLPGHVHQLESVIERFVERTLDDLADRDNFDVVEDYAARISVAVICHLLGIDASMAKTIRRWTLDIAHRDGCAVFWQTEDRETIARLERSMAEQSDFFGRLVAERRKHPKDDLLSTICTSLSDDRQVVSLAILLAAAGNETTTNLIAHGLQELIRHPAQLADLRQHPELMSQAVEEMLRYRGTIRKLDRIANTDCEIDGVEISRGDSIALWAAAANRDPEIVERPEEFDIRRRQSRHLSFGTGIHTCLGNILARMEVSSALGKLLRRANHIEFAGSDAEAYEGWGNGVLHVAKRLEIRVQR